MDFFLTWFTIILCFFATNQNHQYFDWLGGFTWAREMYLYLPALLSLSHAWKSSSIKMFDLLIMIVLVITMKINSYEYNTCNPRWTIAATSSLLTWVITNTLHCLRRNILNCLRRNIFHCLRRNILQKKVQAYHIPQAVSAENKNVLRGHSLCLYI